MNHLLILYNPYYQQDVIQQHLSVLQEKSQVGFGKIRSKLNDQEKHHSLEEIYKATSEENFLQLFLTDYANLFAAKVIKVSKEIDESLIPSYYKEKNLEVEDFFIISDLRDQFLANFIAPNNHTYAIYGNNYVYPLPVRLKEERSYFLGDEKHYLSVYKSKEYLIMQENFMRFVFGKRLFYLLHPDSINNIIHAELELLQSENDLLNDFTSIIVKYSKTLEYEIYLFAKKVLLKACTKDPNLYDLDYKVQGKSLILEDFFTQKPNLGSIKYLLRHEKIQYHLEENLNRFINYPFSKSLTLIQDIRNEAVHEKAPSLHEVKKLRNEILDIEGASLLKSILTRKEAL
ncbi:HP0729 family protein [Helicobacter pylori]|uniref:ATP-binding protein n=1 Tax=Helicobacter pylori TaxID=210 RepID=A0AAE7ANL5_HELPX|nr:HP0729 family protein [Helicobacter pylori]QJW29387.1 ATP-binding protein [Helicobacter pylori A45]QJW40676.1 ATP-binding protein [Helicobacter pylori]QJW42136.1 ATP-binding protein [Helicobacter pylori]QJW43592.1 ATP-binding protein [Helicobacter pylori]